MFKFLKKKQQYSSPNNGEKSQDSDKKFFSIRNFKKRLAVEKRRTQRLDYKFSLIKFNFSSKLENPTFPEMDDVVQSIYSGLRLSDEICFFKNSIILLLLPDTNFEQAEHVSEKLLNQLKEKFPQPEDDVFREIPLEILTFPEKKPESMITGSAPNRQTENAVHFKREYIENINVCVNAGMSMTMVLPLTEIFFWDQEIVSTFIFRFKKDMKRMMDFWGALFGIILLSPIFLLIAMAIKLTSAGPVFFKQQRVGFRGRPFTFLKFRSMRANNDNSTHQEYVKQLIQGNHGDINNGTQDDPFYKMRTDSRITPVGKFLRRTSLDELPQLFNVLSGDMSLVGPRPPIPYETEVYQNWHYRRVLDVKPGITGLWQVSGRNRLTFDEMVRLDIQYTRDWSLWLDLKILLKTFRAVVEGS